MTNLVKKKRISKKSKQSWRKHVDIKDVDAFLEDKRLQERLGPDFALRTDNELFKIDNKPNEVKLTSKQNRRLALKNAPLKCFSMLESHSKVPDPIAKRNRVRTPLERRNEILKRIEKSRSAAGILKLRDKVAIQNREKSRAKKKAEKVIKGTYDSDVWNDTTGGITVDINKGDWLSPEAVRHNLNNIGHTVKSIPKSCSSKKVYSSAIEPPHPGTSYNPSIQDHRELLSIIAEKEQGLIKEEKHLLRVTSKMFSKVSQNQKDTNWLTEMSEGLPNKTNNESEDEHSNDSEEEAIDGCYSTINPPVKNKKKDLKQKRKIREQRALKHELKNARKEKKKIADIYKLKVLNDGIAKKSKQEENALKRRKEVKLIKEKGTKVLGKVKFEEPELEFNMKNEIAGNLRNIKKQGNLLEDRFKSLQKRNIIEPTLAQGLRKRTKVKRFVKKSHQDV